MSAPMDVRAATAEESSVVPPGMTEVCREEFFDKLRADNRDVMPATPEWDANRELHSIWFASGHRKPWGWSHSDGRFALARVGGDA